MPVGPRMIASDHDHDPMLRVRHDEKSGIGSDPNHDGDVDATIAQVAFDVVAHAHDQRNMDSRVHLAVLGEQLAGRVGGVAPDTELPRMPVPQRSQHLIGFFLKTENAPDDLEQPLPGLGQ